jgi:FtsH-binding integral membrane protein
MAMNPIKSRSASKLWYVLLVAPFVALLWVPFYNSIEPVMWGIPFFYWYQFLWVFLTSGIIIWVLHKVG